MIHGVSAGSLWRILSMKMSMLMSSAPSYDNKNGDIEEFPRKTSQPKLAGPIMGGVPKTTKKLGEEGHIAGSAYSLARRRRMSGGFAPGLKRNLRPFSRDPANRKFREAICGFTGGRNGRLKSRSKIRGTRLTLQKLERGRNPHAETKYASAKVSQKGNPFLI